MCDFSVAGRRSCLCSDKKGRRHYGDYPLPLRTRIKAGREPLPKSLRMEIGRPVKCICDHNVSINGNTRRIRKQ